MITSDELKAFIDKSNDNLRASMEKSAALEDKCAEYADDNKGLVLQNLQLRERLATVKSPINKEASQGASLDMGLLDRTLTSMVKANIINEDEKAGEMQKIASNPNVLLSYVNTFAKSEQGPDELGVPVDRLNTVVSSDSQWESFISDLSRA